LPLPKEGTPEWDQEVQFYLSSSIEDRAKRATELGYASRVSYETRMREKGVYMNQAVNIPMPGNSVSVNLPPIHLREYVEAPNKVSDEEAVILHCSDGHAGKVTKTFDEDVYRARMDTIFDSTMKIVTLHRKMYPMNKLYIVNTGDNVQGENPFQGSKVGSIKLGARDQTTKLAFPAWARLIGSLRQEFSEVVFDGLGGNHSYDKLSPETSTEDFRLYDLLQSYYSSTKGVTINIHEEFADIITINGYKFFCTHGDGIVCQNGIPFFAIQRKLMSWHVQFGGFSYALMGHFHKRHSDEIASNIEYFMCGSLVSSDDWALKKMGISSNPSQWILGCHPKMGVTWRYSLVVDHDFLPPK
jgi:hypothetical protein